ncbi:Glutathione synthetase [Saezia sanguinis]|uniref:Glutathione synthetase n=1 Tax=Saezia sanguinis TaxID=1965230 RepID=A0A433SGQ3_9BURK|nr:glutathione synthase [Saezia sanguinis]RUS67902.1 Glutathione synthetase [Saezia sanguinis]
MDILFVADPIDTFKTYKDSTFAMMREAAGRGHAIYACVPSQMSWIQGGQVRAQCLKLEMTGRVGTAEQELHDWYNVLSSQTMTLSAFDAIVMRKDPPFDSEYFYATHLLEQAQREGTRVFNQPSALRDHPEKMALMEFPQYAPPTLISRDPVQIRGFHAAYNDIILKPLDGMGGAGIFRIREDGMNLGSAIEALNRFGQQTIMVQQYQPAIAQGDKRILIIDGEPAPYVLARIPQGNEVRGNLAAGGRGVAQPLSDANRAVAKAIGEKLAPRGLLLIGLDMIGDHVTEINVTSPTCFQEIEQQTGFNVAGMFVDALEKAVSS